MLTENAESAVILIGKGLVGNSIYFTLKSGGYILVEQKKLDWSSFQNVVDISSFIRDKILTLSEKCQLTILWSAGKLGFSAIHSEIVTEKKFFTEVCQSLSKLSYNGLLLPRFILFSSIGGLFEGKTAISDYSIPNPQRPYGHLKLHQEITARKILINFDVIILRLSSVYGPINRISRMGLIQVLIINGLQYKNSIIFGSLDTLRDYVFVDDISRFVSDLVISTHVNINLFHLVSGKPSSIFQIKHIVERLLFRTLLLSFDKEKNNSLDIPCVINTYNGDWQPSSLEVNIKKIYEKWLTYND